MNKNYRNILITGIITLSAGNGLLGLEVPGKACFVDTHENSFSKAATNYLLSYVALYSTIPVVSAGFIKAWTGAPLKNSMTDFKAINRDLGKKLLKTMPVTAAGAYVYNTLQNNIAQ